MVWIFPFFTLFLAFFTFKFCIFSLFREIVLSHLKVSCRSFFVSERVYEICLNYIIKIYFLECFGTPEIIQTPGGQDVIRVAKGSNETFTCQFFCLENENFGNFTWMFGNGEPIPQNSLKYKLVNRPVDTNELSYGRRRLNYEMSLTIINISNIEIFSCNHSSPNRGQSDSKTFRLHVEKGM